MATKRKAVGCTVAITLMVAAVQPVPSATMPRSQNQQVTSPSQNGTASTSDPCSSFADTSAAVSDRPSAEERSEDNNASANSTGSARAVKVNISPHARMRLAAGYTLRLTAIVSGATDTRIDWAVAGPGCSDSTCGDIEGGVYFAPSVVPSPPMVKLTATSKADPTASDWTEVCIVQHGPQWNLLSSAGTIQTAEKASSWGFAGAKPGNSLSGDVEVLTDTMGVDFDPYLQKAIHDIKENWYRLIPEVARSPILRKGTVSIEFAIAKNGQITGLHYVSGSGDVALDRAVYGGIMASNPLPALPRQFAGQNLGLRMTFRYNQDPIRTPEQSRKQTHQNQRLTGISPPRVEVPAGTSILFVPILNGISDQTKFPITWSIVGDCPAETCGTISENGIYTAPQAVPVHPIIFVKARADAVKESYSAVVTIVPSDQSQNIGQH